MCGRYALGIRASLIRYQLQQQGLPVDDAPDDGAARETYNFPPGSYGLVYRADIPDHALRDEEKMGTITTSHGGAEPAGGDEHSSQPSSTAQRKTYPFHLKVMKWGLIPFWTKRAPDYSSMMRTINCRDDSLAESRGMWTTMKQHKRCIVIAQGFYEWLKRGPGGKERIPHFVKRKDGALMCFAGLWDCVKYEDSDDRLYTYSIVTTDANKRLRFLHDRMPVILDQGSEAMKIWLDPERKWSRELQALLKPYEGELECYPVSKEVGKVGNNSPDFIVPIDSRQNKKNIVNFFDNAKKASPKKEMKTEAEIKASMESTKPRKTVDHEGSEDNAPIPVLVTTDDIDTPKLGAKRKVDEVENSMAPKVARVHSPLKKAYPPTVKSGKKARSAISNEGIAMKKSLVRMAADGSQRITNFFRK